MIVYIIKSESMLSTWSLFSLDSLGLPPSMFLTLPLGLQMEPVADVNVYEYDMQK